MIQRHDRPLAQGKHGHNAHFSVLRVRPLVGRGRRGKSGRHQVTPIAVLAGRAEPLPVSRRQTGPGCAAEQPPTKNIAVNELNTLSKRLDHLRESQGWSKTALSRFAQASRAAVARWYADGPMPDATAKLLCDEAEGPWNPQWLMDGTGPMMLAGTTEAQASEAAEAAVASAAPVDASPAGQDPTDEPPAKADDE